MKRRMISLVLALCMILFIIPATVSAASVVASGTCGESLTWVLTDDGTLTISGEGEMDGDDDPYRLGGWRSPWYPYRSWISKVVVEDGVTTIGGEVFHAYYDNITEVILPDSLEAINDYAFHSCNGLSKITIPDSVSHIGEMAFGHCDSLTEIDIPDSVTHLGAYAFYSCDSLRDVSFTDSICVLNQGVFLECEALRSVAIPQGITDIEDCAFSSCYQLEEVTIPDSVVTMGKYAFSYCKNLRSITIPGSVAFIDDYAFDHSSKLTQIVFRRDAPLLGEQVFSKISTIVYYPADNPTWTPDVMQSYGGVVTWVPYGDAGEIAAGWSGDTQWTLTYDGVLTFSGNGSMKNYDWDGGQPWAKYADQITSVVIEEGVTAVGTSAFKDLTKLESVTLPDSGLKKIGEAAFYGCTALKDIYIPDGIYTIWEYTFKNCTSLEEVRLPKTLVKLDQGAFEGCSAMPYLLIPGTTEIIGSWSFKGCTGLLEVDMHWADATEIREGAFKNCSALNWIYLPENIQVLGDSSFYGIGATQFVVPATVTEIRDWCFARASLEQITFEGDAPPIGEGAFNKITVTACYPGDNATWTADNMLNYGGTITWTAM